MRVVRLSGLKNVLLAAFIPLGLAAVMLASLPHNAQAATISLDYTATATDFANGTPAFDPAIVSFTLSFDNSATITNSSAGLSVTSNNPFSGSARFTYFAFSDVLTIGANNDSNILSSSTDDFAIEFSDVSTSPTLFVFDVTSASNPLIMFGHTLSANDNSIPEPPMFAMFGAAMLGIAVMRIRNKGDRRSRFMSMA
jgi:hypothetical protein